MSEIKLCDGSSNDFKGDLKRMDVPDIILADDEAIAVNERWSFSRHPPHYYDDPFDESTKNTYVPEQHRYTSNYALRVFPNGEFGIGRIPPETEKIADKRYEMQEVHGVHFSSVPTPYTTVEEQTYYNVFEPYLAPDNLVTARESSQPARKYGLKGITGYGRKSVRNLAVMFEKDFGRKAVTMTTVTVPSFSESHMKVICEKWAYLTSRFFQECRRRFKRYGKKFYYVSVTEIQPERWKKEGEVGLHLHFLSNCIWDRRTKQYLLDANWARHTWRRLLYNILSAQVDIPLPRIQIEKVKHSAAGYIGKYMSKGADIVSEVVESKGAEWVPSQWWSCDSVSRKRLQKAIFYDTGEVAESLLRIISHGNASDFHSISPVVIDTPANGERIVGYSGRLTKETGRAMGLDVRYFS